MVRCMHSGCCCCYGGVDVENLVVIYKGSSTCLCFRQTCCLDVNTKARQTGCCIAEQDDRQEEVCKVGLPCCECGIIEPKTICQGVSQCLCCYNVVSFPFDRNYVTSCSCALAFLQCAPNIGCCSEPPVCTALDRLQSEEMDLNIMERY